MNYVIVTWWFPASGAKVCDWGSGVKSGIFRKFICHIILPFPIPFKLNWVTNNQLSFCQVFHLPFPSWTHQISCWRRRCWNHRRCFSPVPSSRPLQVCCLIHLHGCLISPIRDIDGERSLQKAATKSYKYQWYSFMTTIAIDSTHTNILHWYHRHVLDMLSLKFYYHSLYDIATYHRYTANASMWYR